jgi:hypothetical protein
MKTQANDSINPQIETIERAGEQFYTDIFSTGGLTKREYFAAMAMQGILASSADRGETAAGNMAVKFADAIIQALNKDEK